MSADVIPFRTDPPAWTFSDYLRKARRTLGMTQGKFAAELGVKDRAYGAWEAGTNVPRNIVEIAERLEKVTGYPREWFLGWLDRPGPTGPGGGLERTTGLEPATFCLEYGSPKLADVIPLVPAA